MKRLGNVIGDRAVLRPGASIQLRHGRSRQVTAAVQTAPNHEIFVQAVGGATKDLRERAVEHCTFLFNQAADVPQDQRLAVASGHRKDWDDYFVKTLGEAGSVAFFDDPAELDDFMAHRLQPSI